MGGPFLVSKVDLRLGGLTWGCSLPDPQQSKTTPQLKLVHIRFENKKRQPERLPLNLDSDGAASGARTHDLLIHNLKLSVFLSSCQFHPVLIR